MYKNLDTGAVGIRVDSVEQAIALAKKHGFGGLSVGPGEAAKVGPDKLRGMLQAARLQPGCWGLPVPLMGKEQDYQKALPDLPRQCELARQAGMLRCATWVPSWSDDLPFDQCFERLRSRTEQVATVLKPCGIRLGLEFLGPKTLRNGHKYEFIYTLEGMLDLCKKVGTGNVGLLLDGWHWYVGHGTTKDLELLTDDTVILVHVNDAPLGKPLDELADNVRGLPASTGRLPIKEFMGALARIKYTGPVVVEPFDKELSKLPADEIAAKTIASLDAIWPK